MTELTISDAEWQVMQVIWRLGKATAADVIAALSESTDWSHRTIRTLLGRLVEKGALSSSADGNRYVYKPLVTRQKCVRAEGRSFLNKVFAGDAAELLVHFTQEARMTPEQIEELKRLLDAKRPRRE
jgi:BlaI family transcriptional regulator, penicillinase repressor